MYRALLALCLLAGLAAAQAKPAPAPADDQSQLTALMALDEPGAQLRGLEAYLKRYPASAQRTDIYNTLIQDATALNDPGRVLLYNEKLEELDPNDLAQRIKTINLLLASSTPADRQRARQEADLFARMVEAKAQEKPPAEMGETRWRLNVARLRSLAGLFQGSADQALGDYADAEKALLHSLEQSQSEEAAEHLAQVDLAEDKLPQALDNFALALALPGQTIAGRAKLRAQAGALYRQLHQGSEAGFGDLILHQFDAVAARDASEQAELTAADHAGANAAAASAQAFVLTSLDGARHSLAEAKGKVAVLDFWATWCGPCLVQHPLLAAAAQRFEKDHRVIFISINEDEDRERVAPFLAAHHWAPTTWLDAGLGSWLGVDSLPTTLILDPAGRIVYRGEGFVPDTFETQLEAAISGALARAFPGERAGAPSGR